MAYFNVALFGAPGGHELLIVVGILVLFFGARRLPELARALGQSLNEFKKGKEDALLDEPSDGPDEKKQGSSQ